MPYQVRMTYTNPPRTRQVVVDGVEQFSWNGMPILERIPGHPTRPARAWEVDSWWEDIHEDDLNLLDDEDVKGLELRYVL